MNDDIAIPAPAPSPVLSMAGVTRSFERAGNKLEVLRGIDLQVMPGEIVSLIGPSGSGKSTMLHIAGLLERPDGGALSIGTEDASRLRERARTRLRRETIGFVYQFHHLLPEFSALENVLIPQMIAGRNHKKATERARELLEAVGLAQRMDHRPAHMSGGEQQRVAIARALANEPKILIADEPTGNLDESTSEDVFMVLQTIIRQTGLCALIATHNLSLAARMDKSFELHEGRIQT